MVHIHSSLDDTLPPLLRTAVEYNRHRAIIEQLYVQQHKKTASDGAFEDTGNRNAGPAYSGQLLSSQGF